MTDLEWYARKAYQNGDRKLQAGWWAYAKDAVIRLGHTEAELVSEIGRLKSSTERRSDGACERI